MTEAQKFRQPSPHLKLYLSKFIGMVSGRVDSVVYAGLAKFNED